jgi:hypothetical protein
MPAASLPPAVCWLCQWWLQEAGPMVYPTGLKHSTEQLAHL